MTRLLLTATLGLLLLAGCGGAGEAEAEVELPGDYASIIASEGDCDELQDIFNSAETASSTFRDREDLNQAAAFTAVMGAANDRMQEVGC